MFHIPAGEYVVVSNTMTIEWTFYHSDGSCRLWVRPLTTCELAVKYAVWPIRPLLNWLVKFAAQRAVRHTWKV